VDADAETMKTIARMDRERAKQLLAEVDIAASGSSKSSEARQKVVRLLNQVPTYNWVGIYIVKGNDLHVDAWAGPAATVHTVIPVGKGVCGWAAKSGKTEIVSDVSKDPRYLQCFTSTRSEIVVPIVNQGKVVGEIDINSDQLNAHSSIDREFLEAVAGKLAPYCVA
jgi:L-methionine (R)-S-oxide reductase